MTNQIKKTLKIVSFGFCKSRFKIKTVKRLGKNYTNQVRPESIENISKSNIIFRKFCSLFINK